MLRNPLGSAPRSFQAQQLAVPGVPTLLLVAEESSGRQSPDSRWLCPGHRVLLVEGLAVSLSL